MTEKEKKEIDNLYFKILNPNYKPIRIKHDNKR
jgi:hypothetical protein